MGRIILYTTAGCVASSVAKALLHAHGISFVEIDLQKSPLSVDELSEVANGDRTVPKLVFNYQVIGVRDPSSTSTDLLRELASLARIGTFSDILYNYWCEYCAGKDFGGPHCVRTVGIVLLSSSRRRCGKCGSASSCATGASFPSKCHLIFLFNLWSYSGSIFWPV